MNILNFINSLIFAIVAATASIVIMFMMFSDKMQEYLVVMGVVEIGLLAIVIWCLISIVNYDIKIAENIANAKTNVGYLPGCPDNWTISNTETKLDKNGNVTGILYSCQPQVSLDSANSGYYFEYRFGQNPAAAVSKDSDAFKRMESSVGTATNLDLCGMYNQAFRSDNESGKYGEGAWTSMDSKCDTLAL